MDNLIENLENLKSQYNNKIIDVGYGFKIKNGFHTNEKAIIFIVDKKIPVSELSKDQILPTSLMVNNEQYNTDVIEHNVKLLACDWPTIYQCYSGWSTTYVVNGVDYGGAIYGRQPINRTQTWIPIRGGMSITTNVYSQGYLGGGTLGFVAIDKLSGIMVGVSNQHVLDNAGLRPSGVDLSNFPNTCNKTTHCTSAGTEYEVGVFLRSSISSAGNSNDFAITALYSGVTDNQSWKQIGLDINYAPQFATTNEINNSLGLQAFSSGARSGAKGNGFCNIKISFVNSTQIWFSRENPDCGEPADGGDSGSAILANFNGVWKIVGLLWGRLTSSIIGSRIDNLAKMLNIEAWDGVTTPKFINPNSIKINTFDSNFKPFFFKSNNNQNLYSSYVGTTRINHGNNISAVTLTYNTLNKIIISGNSNFEMNLFKKETFNDFSFSAFSASNIYNITSPFTDSSGIVLNFNNLSAVTHFEAHEYITNINNLSLLPSLKTIDISKNNLTGFTLNNNPTGLTSLNLSSNNLTGFTFNNNVPDTLTNFNISYNYLNINEITNILVELSAVTTWVSPGVINISKQITNATINQGTLAEQALQSLISKGWTVIADTGVKTYYVSSLGNDANDGLSDTRPWKSLEKVRDAFLNQIITEGDTVLFKRGEIFSATSTNEYVIDLDGLTNAKSGINGLPIKIGAYGSSSQKPILMTNKNNILFRLANMKYYIFENLNFTDLTFNSTDKINKATFRRAIVLGGWITTPSNPTQLFSGASSNCTISNCDFSNMGNAVTIVGNYNLMSGCTISNLKAGADLPSNPSDIGGTGVFITGSYNQIFRGDISGCWYANTTNGFDGGVIKALNPSTSFNTLNYSTVSDCASVLEINPRTNTALTLGNFKLVYNKLVNNGKPIIINNYSTSASFNGINTLLINNIIVENSNSRFSGPNYGTGIKTIPSIWQVWSGRTYAPNLISLLGGSIITNYFTSLVNNIVFSYNGQTVFSSDLFPILKNNIFKLLNSSTLGTSSLSSDNSIFATTTSILITNESNVNPLLWDYNLPTGSIAKDAGVATYATAYPLDFDLNGVVTPPSIGIYD